MTIGFEESTGTAAQSASCTGGGGNDSCGFECNICLELPQEPIVTICGHLYCWPCLYKWLYIHSHSQECPVCKAVIQEEKLVPVYGRGKTPTDPRSKSYPGIDIPNRPSGQRPQTAPPPNTNHFSPHGVGFMGGFSPMATARFGSFTLSAAFGGLFPSLFNLQVHGFPGATLYGTTAGFPYAFSHSFHGRHIHRFPQPTSQGQNADFYLKVLLLMVAVFVILALVFS